MRIARTKRHFYADFDFRRYRAGGNGQHQQTKKANFFAEKWGKVRNFRFTSTGKCAILSRGTQSNPLIPAREAGKARSEPTDTELPAPTARSD